jgi:hypothetical protein
MALLFIPIPPLTDTQDFGEAKVGELTQNFCLILDYFRALCDIKHLILNRKKIRSLAEIPVPII